MMHGFINLNKPAHWTSHDCVAKLRKCLNTKKIGHSGTLDPLATGVLPIAVGKATRLLQYLPSGKAYRAVIRFGIQTTTEDLGGEIIRQTSAAHLQRHQVEALFERFVGEIIQTPPMYSAVQVDGKRLYELARQGKKVDVPTRQVVIKQLRSQQWIDGEHPELTVDVVCGPGTYIRSLARDLGEAVGTGATLAGLTRTYSNGFEIERSTTIETLSSAFEADQFVPTAAGEMMKHLKAIALPSELTHRWCLGQKLLAEEVAPYIEKRINSPANSEHIDSQKAISQQSSNSASIRDLMHQPLRVLTADSQQFLGIGEFKLGLPTAATHPSSPGDATEDDIIFAPKRVYSSV